MREQDRIAAYKWLIDILRKSRYGLTRNEIFELWRDNRDISWGEPLSLATFKRYKDACFDIFKVDIRCDKYHRYYIHNEREFREDNVHQWMLQSLSLSRVLRNSERIYNRILIAPTPSDVWVEYVITAMNNSQMIEIVYQEYDAAEGKSITIEPYCLKTYHHRWSVLGRHRDGTMKVYGLDRVTKVGIIKETFTIDPDFNAEEFFSEYYGVRLDGDVPVQKVVLRAHLNERFILEKQPVHHTQNKIGEGENYADFELTLRPTFDFVTYLESQGRFVEVLEPLWLRKELVRVHREAIERNK